MEIDHVILGVSDLAHGIREFEAMTGVAPQVGGRHPGRDTQNALASLGSDRYVEILAPIDPAAGSKDRRIHGVSTQFIRARARHPVAGSALSISSIRSRAGCKRSS